ncbi:uncharacterized protein LOC131633036 [Vicia villosa]|uniref:uncharacterized protein LOC131633036 n=1 Tax=Vicia villosa TaxID=3911 RepID=UPI00273BB5C8|nr:uncharacterized protein LOC131633036 [Vicia villosa]
MKSSTSSSTMLQGSHESFISQLGTKSELPWKQVCYCGDKAILRRAKTTKSFGRQFWGCPHFKGPDHPGCGFFEWFCEESEEHNGQIMMVRLEKLGRNIEHIQEEFVKIRLSTEEIKKETGHIQSQLKKMMKYGKCCSLMIIIILFVTCFIKD